MSLASLAQRVESAGRGPDRNLVHMSPAELAYLRQNWGPPTTNPQTGLPEYGWFDTIARFAPAAISAFGGGGTGGFATSLGSMLGASDAWAPVVGSAIIGGAGNALMGGGLKGALTGALMGGAGAAISPLIGNALGGTDIGNWLGVADSARDTVFGNGVGRSGVDSVSGGTSDMLGQFFGGDSGSRLDSYAADPAFASARAGLGNAASAASAASAPGGGGETSSWLKYALPALALAGMAGGGGQQAQGAPPPASGSGVSTKLPDLDLAMRPKDTSNIDWYTYGQRPRNATFFDPEWKDAEGRVMAAKGGHVKGYAPGGSVLPMSDDMKMQRWLAMRAPPPATPYAVPDEAPARGRMPSELDHESLLMLLGPHLMEMLAKGGGQRELGINEGAPRLDPRDFARGGRSSGALGALPSRYFAEGPGSGRDDLIEARLSPKEGVLDAEFLALLGDGNPDEGWRRVDEMRVNLRKEKGKALAKGKISPNARPPSSYLGKERRA